MSIYQAPRKRWRVALVTGIAGLAIGFGVGVVVGGGDPDPVDVIRTLDAQLEDVAAPLDVLVIHRDVDTTLANDPQVARDALRRVEQRFDAVRPAMRALNPQMEDEIASRIAKLSRLVAGRAKADEVAVQASELAVLLRGLIGGRPS